MPAKIKGKEALLRKLKALHPAISAALETASGEGAREMVEYAQAFVPVRTGKLRDSIVATPPGQPIPAYAQGAETVPEGAWAVSAGNSEVRYAHLPEYGTKAHVNEGQFPGTENPGARAQPYFWPAYRLMRKRHRGRVGRALGKAVKAIAGR